MNKLVKNLLTLNHLEEGRDEVKMERFDIVSLIKGILQSMDIMIQQKEAKVSFEAEEPVYVWADEFRIEEVVTNYTSNALNHLDGDREIEICVCPEGDRVKLLCLIRESPYRKQIFPMSGKSFIRWIKQEPENMEEVESDFPLSRQLWKAITRSTVSVIMTMVWNSGSPLTEKA